MSLFVLQNLKKKINCLLLGIVSFLVPMICGIDRKAILMVCSLVTIQNAGKPMLNFSFEWFISFKTLHSTLEYD